MRPIANELQPTESGTSKKSFESLLELITNQVQDIELKLTIKSLTAQFEVKK